MSKLKKTVKQDNTRFVAETDAIILDAVDAFIDIEKYFKITKTTIK